MISPKSAKNTGFVDYILVNRPENAVIFMQIAPNVGVYSACHNQTTPGEYPGVVWLPFIVLLLLDQLWRDDHRQIDMMVVDAKQAEGSGLADWNAQGVGDCVASHCTASCRLPF